MLDVQLPEAPKSPAEDLGSPRPSPQVMLQAWAVERADLSCVYSRSRGGFIQTGRAVLTRLEPQHLELRAAGTSSIFLLRGARFSAEARCFYSPRTGQSQWVPGVTISLENQDWLFLSRVHDADLLNAGPVLAK